MDNTSLVFLGDPIVVTEGQRNLHVSSEAVAVFAVAPFMFWLAFQDLPKWARRTSAVIGLGTVLVDGYLLLQYLKR